MSNPVDPLVPAKPDPVGVPWDMLKPHIPKEYQDSGVWQALEGKDVSVLLKNYAEAQKTIGGSVRIPQQDDAEGWNKFWGKLGRPDTPDNYKWDPPQHSKIEWDDEMIKGVREVAHKRGMTQEMYQGVMDFYASQIMNQANAQTKLEDEASFQAEGELKKEYGTNYEYHKQIGLRAAQEYFGEEVGKALADNAKSNPDLFRGLTKLGQEMSEAGTFGEVSPADFGGLTYESAQAKIREVNASKDHPYWDEKHPDHNHWSKEMLKYFQVKPPASR